MTTGELYAKTARLDRAARIRVARAIEKALVYWHGAPGLSIAAVAAATRAAQEVAVIAEMPHRRRG